MSLEQEKMTDPLSLVGANEEQSPYNLTQEIITNEEKLGNNNLDDMLKLLAEYEASDEYQQFLEKSKPGYMETLTMNNLYEHVFTNKPPIIEGLLYPGTYLFVGAPKVGKSFMMAQFAYHVSTGKALWNFEVKQGTVLYLALEDDYRRLQKRLFQMFGVEGTDELYFATSSKQLGLGLNEQLLRFMNEHENTKLIIIDTLQKIRESRNDKYSYSSDYEIITQLKQFADEYGICLLLVHHTRKQQADDKFDMISGTNGLLGAADGVFVLQKEKRTGKTATLEVAGRDQPEQMLHLEKDLEHLVWNLKEVETELWLSPPDEILEAIANLVNAEKNMWCGSPTELVEVLNLDMKANSLTRHLNVKAGVLLSEYNIAYENKPKHSGRRITLSFVAKNFDYPEKPLKYKHIRRISD